MTIVDVDKRLMGTLGVWSKMLNSIEGVVLGTWALRGCSVCRLLQYHYYCIFFLARKSFHLRIREVSSQSLSCCEVLPTSTSSISSPFEPICTYT